MKNKSRILWHSIPSAMLISELPQNVPLLSITAKSERGSFHSKVIQKQLYQKEKKRGEIDDPLCVADNAKDEVHETAQLLKNDATILSIGFLNDGADHQ